MALYKENKLKHLKAMVGKKIGAQTRYDSYVYGRQKAKKVAEGVKSRSKKNDSDDGDHEYR